MGEQNTMNRLQWEIIFSSGDWRNYGIVLNPQATKKL